MKIEIFPSRISKFHIARLVFESDSFAVSSCQPTVHCTTVRLCSEGVTKLFPKGFDRQNSIFLHPHGKRKLAPKLHLSALNFESSRSILLHFLKEKANF